MRGALADSLLTNVVYQNIYTKFCNVSYIVLLLKFYSIKHNSSQGIGSMPV